MKTIITYGTFDLLHRGHIELLRRAREMGDRLVVGLSTDEFNAKKNKRAFFKYEERKLILESIRYVDMVFAEDSWDQKSTDIRNHGAQLLVMGADWAGKFDDLKNLCEVIYLPRTEGISTSTVKARLSLTKDQNIILTDD